MKKLFLILVFLLFTSHSFAQGVIFQRHDSSEKYEWDGRELVHAYKSSIKWLYDGYVVRPKYGFDFRKTFEWNGSELEPRSGNVPERTYIWRGREVMPKYDIDSEEVWVCSSRTCRQKYERGKIWKIQGSVPKPVIIVVILEIVKEK